MQRFLGVLTVVAAILAAFWIYIMNVNSKIFINIGLKSININSLIDSLKEGLLRLETTANIKIENKNNLKIPFKINKTRIFHNKKLIAESLDIPANIKKVTLEPNSKVTVPYTLNIFITQDLIVLFQTTVALQKLNLEYEISATVFGVPIKFRDMFTYPEEEI